MSDPNTITRLRMAAYRRVLPIAVVGFVLSLVIPAWIGFSTAFDNVAVPIVTVILIALWIAALTERVSLRTLDLGLQVSAGGFFLAKALFISWFAPDAGWWEVIEFTLYLPAYFALLFWANARRIGWRVSWWYLFAFLVLGAPHFVRTSLADGPFDRIEAYVYLQVPFVAVLMILFLRAYGEKEFFHQQSLAEAEYEAQVDPLTQVENRRGMEGHLESAQDQFERTGIPFSVLLADIDRFKDVNDTFGHNVGDAVLRDFAQALGSRVREGDRVARWGGEEFAILLPRTQLRQAADLAERLRRSVKQQGFPHGRQLTASFGVSEFRAGDRIEDVIGRADAALYDAKRGGRDQVRVDGHTRPRSG